MTMTFSLHESIEPNGVFDITSYSHGSAETVQERIPLVREKLRVPPTDELIERPRISSLISRSHKQYPATLITGRAGTGKTAIAASYAAVCGNAAWYSVESTETDWPVFARYFSASLDGPFGGEASPADVSQIEVARFFARHFLLPDFAFTRSLIVLDDIHHIFDAPWFGDFFNLLLYSLPSETHLLMLCRSRPPGPLWRLRSKQMLNVLDEKVIAFDLVETEALYRRRGLPLVKAEAAHRGCFGRVSKLLRAA